MGFKRNTIPEAEYSDRLNAVMPKFNQCIQNRQDVTELFELYNDRFTPRKTDRSCGKCVGYVIKRMKLYYEGIK